MTSDIESPKHFPLPRGSLLDAAYRLNVSTLINRAHLAIQNNEWASAETFLRDARDMTPRLQHPDVPKARCCFWLGVLSGRIGRHDLAPGWFARALQCRHHSREGEHLVSYVKKYRHQILEALKDQVLKDSRLETEEKQFCEELCEELRKKILEDEDGKRNEQTLDAELLLESPLSAQSRRGSSDGEDDEEVLRQLIGDIGHLRPDQDRGTALLERSGTIRDRPRPLLLPKDNTKDETRPQSTSLARDIEEFSNGEFVEGLHISSLSRAFRKGF